MAVMAHPDPRNMAHREAPKMMPCQEPYTPAEYLALTEAIDDAAAGDPGEADEPPSCVDCAGKHPDYRSDFGHLDMDPVTGATILVAHRRDAAP